MSGFLTYDEIIAAISVNARGQTYFFNKSMPASGAAGRIHSSWRRSGLPAAGTDPTALTARVVDDSITGALAFVNPTGGRTLHLLRALAMSSAGSPMGTLILADRLLDYGVLDHNSNAQQNLTNDVSLARYTDGKGVMAFLEVTTVLGGVAQNLSMNYDSDVSNGQTSVSIAMRTTAAVDEVPHGVNGVWIPLAAGDHGVKKVNHITFSAAGGGAGKSNLVLCKPLLELPLLQAGVASERDLVMQIASLPRLYDDHALMWILVAAVSATPVLFGSLGAAEN